VKLFLPRFKSAQANKALSGNCHLFVPGTEENLPVKFSHVKYLKSMRLEHYGHFILFQLAIGSCIEEIQEPAEKSVAVIKVETFVPGRLAVCKAAYEFRPWWKHAEQDM